MNLVVFVDYDPGDFPVNRTAYIAGKAEFVTELISRAIFSSSRRTIPVP